MSDVIDLCTGAIALVALGVSLHEVRQANKMHRLSVQPHLTFSRVSGDRSLEITLRNTGLGPARILYFCFFS